MSKNVAVFVDVANIFYAAKAAGVDIDYVTLLKSASAGRDLVRAYAYTGLDPDNENQRNFHSFLARHGYRVVSKDIRKYGDGKVKANLDIELVVDMMKTARNLDIAIVVSGDGDFAPAIRAVQEMGVRVEVISFRGNTSSDLIDVADTFTDITALAKVEKGSSRSGRRVAEAADEDLSMTEVPDKQTEGAGDRRRGGRGRGGRGRGREEETAARAPRRPIGEPAAVTSSGAPLVILPGEKLSRAASGPAGGDVDDIEELGDPETGGAVAAFGGGLGGFENRGLVDVDNAESANGASGGDVEGEADGEDAERRRRRRRGGRGRGRGRGREGEAQEQSLPIGAAANDDPAGDDEGYEEPVEAPRGPRTTPFGSVWDSQLGVPSMPAMPAGAGPAPLGDDEDFEEPEIPEYLIAERRNRGRQGGPGGPGGRGGRGGGPRGGRSAYAAAMDRERYGRGGGGGGINRYPDVSGRERPVEPRRDERPARPVGGGGAGAGGGAPRRSGGDEPWSEVPPELEAMLRAQLGSRPADRRPEPRPAPRSAETHSIGDAPVPMDPLASEPATDDEAVTAEAGVVPDGAYATAEAPSLEPVEATPPVGAEAAPRRRVARRTRTTVPADVAGDATADTGVETGDAAETEAAAPKRRTTRRRTTAAVDEATSPAGDAAPAAGAAPDEAAEAPKRRTTRRRTTAAGAEPTEGEAPAADATGDEAAPAPKRRTTRRKTTEEPPAE